MFDYLKKLLGFESAPSTAVEPTNLEIKLPEGFKLPDFQNLYLSSSRIFESIDLLNLEQNPQNDRPSLRCGFTIETINVYPNAPLVLQEARLNSPPPFHPGEPGKNNGFVFFDPRKPFPRMPTDDLKENNPAP